MKREFIIAILCLTFFGSFALAHDTRGNTGKDQAFRLGYDEGYRDGTRHGRDDYRAGRGYDLRSEEYKRADDGYNNSLGHKGDYKKGYREGYEAGYRSAYQGSGYGRGDSGRYPNRYPDYSRYPDSRYPYPQNSGSNQAFEQGRERGYRDGQEKGLEDYRKNRNPDVNRHGDYRDADNGYRSGYGSKTDYQAGYRRGFEQGYSNGFNGSRGGYRNYPARTF